MDLLRKSIKEFSSEYLNQTEEDNYTKDYVGIVEDNKDPEKIGRCKVRVHGLYNEILLEDLPWATPSFPISFGVKGSFIVPEVGTTVEVTFDDGDLYEPKYGVKVLDTANLNFEAHKDEDYPDSVIFYESKDGDYMKVNRFRGEFTLKTGAGVMLKFSENGDINLFNTNSENGDCKLRLKGNFTLDNKLSDFNLSTSKISVSAFSDIDIKSNGGIKAECLDDVQISTNRDINLVSSDRVSTKARSEIRTETIINNILANVVEILPATSELTTKDVDGNNTYIPISFSVNIGDDDSLIPKVPFMYVVSDITKTYKGGPFNSIPFDPLTGQPHQGRVVKGVISSKGFVKDNLVKDAEILKMKTSITTKYANMLSESLLNITKKYASIDSQAQLIVSTITGSSVLVEQKALEIENVTKTINDSMKNELDNVDSLYSKYLTEPIYGYTKNALVGDGPEYERSKYNVELKLAETTVLEDITGKSCAKDLVGAGKGIINDDNT